AMSTPRSTANGVFYLANAQFKLTGRIALNGYYNLERYNVVEKESHFQDHAGTILHSTLRLGLGIHIGKKTM
ncbi:MAG: hypothetical protein HKN32_03425, partial [Flavobacteriales bacterium]|nr:hypothetical protein [Flavobacteriales bacterium]